VWAMLGRTYDDQICSIARALEVLGERWTLLIVRDALLGLRRFEDFQRSLGIARNVLTDRLNRLVEAGVLERVRYHDHPPRYEYELTATGRDLTVPLIALMHWGDRHLAAAGPPRLTRHNDCGGDLLATLTCTGCGEQVATRDVDVLPGPALRSRTSR
jgi:DNA-binding HxlR family transcriptional regulator